MSVVRLILILIFLKFNINRIQSIETTCLVNGKKPLNVVDERFLSFSLDPATLLTGFNASSTTMKLARRLSPAFIRIAGPSTQLLQFSEDRKIPILFFGNTIRFAITPAMWKSLNNWIKGSHLTPIFAINDKNTLKGIWYPKSIYPLLDVNEKNNFTCYWQLGYDCKYKSLYQYTEDLTRLKHALDEYPSVGKISKIVGSNLQPCLSNRSPEFSGKALESLDDVVNAVMWEQHAPIGDFVGNFPTRSPVPVWLMVPKATQPVTFSSGVLWAKQIGQAAQAGYKVIFRQPRFYELFTDTPVYWISLIYKTFMGRNVLEVTRNSLPDSSINIYAHCTKNQENYPKQGAITVFIINNSSYEHITSLRVVKSYPSSIEVQSYILTSDRDDSRNIYLNGEILTLDKLEDEHFQFTPKIRKGRVNTMLNLASPAKSVGFFVLPGARASVCIGREDDTQHFLKKLQRDQNANFHSSSAEDLTVKIPEKYKNKLYGFMHQELKEDKKNLLEIPHVLKKQFSNSGKLKQKNNLTLRNQQATKEFRQQLISKIKPPEKKENGEKTAKLEIIFTERPAGDNAVPSHIKTIELKLTNEEIRQILTSRAKQSVAEEDIDITSHELENILKEAAENVLKSEDTAMATLNKRKRFAAFDIFRRANDKARDKVNHYRRRTKRGINMELLNQKTISEKPSRSRFVDTQEIQATIRKPGETSEELLKDVEESSEKVRDVFAELANSMESHAGPSKFATYKTFGLSRQPFGATIHRPIQHVPEETHCAKYVDERLEFLMEPEEVDSFLEDDLSNHHSFYENLRQEEMVNPRPRFTNGVRKTDASARGQDENREDSPSVKTIRSRFSTEPWGKDGFGRGKNDGKANLPSYEVTRSRTKVKGPEIYAPSHLSNEETGDLPSSDKGRHQFNKEIGTWDMLPSESVGKIEDPFSSELVKFQTNKMWATNTFSHESSGNISSTTIKPPLNNEVWGKNWFSLGNKTKTENMPFFNLVISQISNELLRKNTFPRANHEEVSSPKTTRSPLNKPWKDNSFYQKNESKAENSPSSQVANPGISRKTNTSSQANGTCVPLTETGRASLNSDMWKTCVFSQDSDRKVQNLPSPEMIKAPLNNKLWVSDAVSQKENGNIEPLRSKTVTLQDNMKVWGIDTFHRENNGKIEKLPSFTTVKPPLNNEVKETRILSSANSAKVSPSPETTIVNKTSNKVDDILCNPRKDLFPKNKPCDHLGSNQHQTRCKRDVSNITKNDIKNYKKFMIDQLRSMRKARNNKRIQTEKVFGATPKNLIGRNKPKLLPLADLEEDNLSSEEKSRFVVERPQKPEKPLISETRIAKQLRALQERRQNRKKLHDKIRERKLQEMEDVQNDLINYRRKRAPYNIKTNEVYKSNAIVKQYEPKIVRRREWKPQDIVRVKKVPSYSVEVVDNREFLQRAAPFVKDKIKGTKKHKRSVRDGTDAKENTIDDYPFKEFRKLSKLLSNVENESLYERSNYSDVNTTEKNSQNRNSTQGWAVTTADHTNEVTSVISTKTSEITTANGSVGGVATSRTRSEEVTPNETETNAATTDVHTEKPSEKPTQEVFMYTETTEPTIIPPNFVDMIMLAVNSTVSKFVHLGEKIARQLSF